jgi:hypothetical protein
VAIKIQVVKVEVLLQLLLKLEDVFPLMPSCSLGVRTSTFTVFPLKRS